MSDGFEFKNENLDDVRADSTANFRADLSVQIRVAAEAWDLGPSPRP